MIAILLVGFLLGLKHALEADHVAAVAALAARGGGLRDTIRVALSWSTGHAATLILLGSALVVFGAALPEPLTRGFEALVGVVLAGLGVDVLRRLWQRRIHVHVHEHGERSRHLHFHTHEHETAHPARAHEHGHPRGVLVRSLAVGGLHGLAGSGALVLLSLQQAGSTARALAYLVLFSLGSIAGMVAFSTAISLPLRSSARWAARASSGVEAALGATSVGLGVWIALRSAGF